MKHIVAALLLLALCPAWAASEGELDEAATILERVEPKAEAVLDAPEDKDLRVALRAELDRAVRLADEAREDDLCKAARIILRARVMQYNLKAPDAFDQTAAAGEEAMNLCPGDVGAPLLYGSFLNGAGRSDLAAPVLWRALWRAGTNGPPEGLFFNMAWAHLLRNEPIWAYLTSGAQLAAYPGSVTAEALTAWRITIEAEQAPWLPHLAARFNPAGVDYENRLFGYRFRILPGWTLQRHLLQVLDSPKRLHEVHLLGLPVKAGEGVLMVNAERCMDPRDLEGRIRVWKSMPAAMKGQVVAAEGSDVIYEAEKDGEILKNLLVLRTRGDVLFVAQFTSPVESFEANLPLVREWLATMHDFEPVPIQQ